ncbi:TolC family protein [Paludisphaera mucosa]|uniref:TolC family protein n=1 Tax=Paludisphaera mucosa TaxID=3030827 RepID=A0ABT6FHF3_9BACT|nr:TolC family protein [Paludisphaera mucosa]MDG3006820.1 TolC family protein [Paludisphaera mucosa]
MYQGIQASRPAPGRWRSALVLGALGLASASSARGQAPEFDVPDPPGVSAGRSMLGPAPGAAGSGRIGGADEPVIGGRAGPSATRAPLDSATPRSGRGEIQGQPDLRVRALPEASVPTYGALDLPAADVPIGGEEGYSIDDAIAILLQRNLTLLAMKYEIPMAEADVLTAGLWSNPIFYADAQLVPYGHYSSSRPGGQTQYDVNITHPIDANGKRRMRKEVARVAKRAVEAQFQDAVRRQIDNLYTSFVDVAAAKLTLEYSRKYEQGIAQLLTINADLLEKKQISEDPVFALRAQHEASRVQVREATLSVTRTTRTLAQLLDVPRDQALSIQIKDRLRDERTLPMPEDQLVALALERRPDLAAMRLGVQRAHADVRLAQRERLSDFYLLCQPYTLQDNRPSGVKSPTSWAFGLTAPMPLYNRNQGNIARAHLNVDQTHLELARMERQVQDEVVDAANEFELSRLAMIEAETRILPASRRVRDAAFRRWQGGESNILEFLAAQRDFNERVRDYRDVIVRHRRASLDLDSAVAMRVLP